MFTLETFLLLLVAVSTFTGLATEAVKKVFKELKMNYYTNILTGVISLILSVAIGVGYTIVSSVAFTPGIIVSIIALTFVSWLCAMVGYDKVVQAVSQFKTKGDA